MLDISRASDRDGGGGNTSTESNICLRYRILWEFRVVMFVGVVWLRWPLSSRVQHWIVAWHVLVVHVCSHPSLSLADSRSMRKLLRLSNYLMYSFMSYTWHRHEASMNSLREPTSKQQNNIQMISRQPAWKRVDIVGQKMSVNNAEWWLDLQEFLSSSNKSRLLLNVFIGIW